MKHTADLFYRDDVNEDGYFSHLTATSGVTTIGRDPTRASFAMMYGLAQGYTLDQIENMTQEERYDLGDDAVNFMRANPTVGVTEGAEKKALAAYGQLYAKAARQLLKEPFPTVVYGEPESVRRARERLEHFRSIAIDYSQSKERLTKRKDFVDQFGGERGLENLDARMQNAAVFSQLPLQAYEEIPPMTDEESVKGLMVMTAANRAVMERHRDGYEQSAGKSLDQAMETLSEGQPGQRIEIEVAIVQQAAAKRDRGKVEAYLSGDGSLFDREEKKELDRLAESATADSIERARRRQAPIRQAIQEEAVFDSWYQKREQELRGSYRQSEMEAWRRKEIAANMIRGRGRNSASMWAELRGREDQIPFMDPGDQPIAHFLLSTMNRLNEEADSEQLRMTTLMNMKRSLEADDEEARREMPDPAMREKTLREIDQRIARAQKPLTMDSTEQNMRIFIDAVLDQMSGEPMESGAGAKAREAFEKLPETVRDSIREGMDRELRERAPLDVAHKEYTLEDLMDRVPVMKAVPEAVTMRFEELQEIDANTLTAHIARPSKLTELERDYAISTFRQAFGALGSKEQQERMKEAGLDSFDLITINGKSVREQFGKKYAGLEPARQEEMFQCEVVAAALKPDQKISFAVIEEGPNDTYELSPSIAVNRGGELHEPKPTLGQRFLNFFGIRKITPLKERMQQANQLKDGSRSDFDARRRQLEGSIKKASVAHKGKRFHGRERVDREYERLVGVPFGTELPKEAQGPDAREQQERLDRADGFVNLRRRSGLSSLGRPTATMAILYGQMLKEGMTLKEVLDPDAREEDKLRIARETSEAMKTPEGAGRLLAESTRAFCDVDLKKQFSELLGRDIKTPDDMTRTLTARDMETVAAVQPAMKFLFTQQRELYQITNSFLPGKGAKTPALDACRDAYFDHMDMEHISKRQNLYLFNRFQGINHNEEVYVQLLAGGPEEVEKLGDVRTAAAQAAIMKGLYRNLAEADSMGAVQVPADQYEAYQEAVQNPDRISENSARDFLRTLGDLSNRTQRHPFERSLSVLSQEQAGSHWEDAVRRGLTFDKEQLVASAERKDRQKAADSLKAGSAIPLASANVGPMPTAESLKAVHTAEAKKPQLAARTSFAELSQRLAPPKKSRPQPETAKKAPVMDGAAKSGPRTTGR